MFVLGAKTATAFLLEFKWSDYKDARMQMQKDLTKAHTSTSNNSTTVSK